MSSASNLENPTPCSINNYLSLHQPMNTDENIHLAESKPLAY